VWGLIVSRTHAGCVAAQARRREADSRSDSTAQVRGPACCAVLCWVVTCGSMCTPFPGHSAVLQLMRRKLLKHVSKVCIAAHQAHCSGGLAPSSQLNLRLALPAGDLPGLPRQIVPIQARRARRASTMTQNCCAAEAPGHTASRRPRALMCTLAGRGPHDGLSDPRAHTSGVQALARRTGTGSGDPGHLAASSASGLQPALATPHAWAREQRRRDGSCSVALTCRTRTGRARTSTHHRAATIAAAQARGARLLARALVAAGGTRVGVFAVCVAHACAPEHERAQVPGSVRPCLLTEASRPRLQTRLAARPRRRALVRTQHQPGAARSRRRACRRLRSGRQGRRGQPVWTAVDVGGDRGHGRAGGRARKAWSALVRARRSATWARTSRASARRRQAQPRCCTDDALRVVGRHVPDARACRAAAALTARASRHAESPPGGTAGCPGRCGSVRADAHSEPPPAGRRRALRGRGRAAHCQRGPVAGLPRTCRRPRSALWAAYRGARRARRPRRQRARTDAAVAAPPCALRCDNLPGFSCAPAASVASTTAQRRARGRPGARAKASACVRLQTRA